MMTHLQFPCVPRQQLGQDITRCTLAAHRLRLDVAFALATLPPDDLPPLAEKLEDIANVYLELAEKLSRMFVNWRREEYASSAQMAFAETAPD